MLDQSCVRDALVLKEGTETNGGWGFVQQDRKEDQHPQIPVCIGASFITD